MPSSISLLLRTPKETILYVWQHREGDVSLKLDPGVNADWLVERYPRRLAPWTVSVETITRSSSSRRSPSNGPGLRLVEPVESA
jgi:hypothetical protein